MRPAQAAQAVLKTYFQAWKNGWEGRAQAPEFKARFRTRMSIDTPQGRDLHVVRVHRRWGMVDIPELGRVRFCWTKDLPVGKHADKDNKITGARLVKDALGRHIAFRVTTLAPAPGPHPGPEAGIGAGIGAGITVPPALSDGETAQHGLWLLARRGGLLAEVPAPGTSQECAQCHTVTPGNRRNQAEFVCNNPACGWEGNADTNAAHTVLHRHRTGHALVPAAGRAVVRRASNGVKPATAR
ncbi:hypothetical protein AQJ91_36630 [Streptomyces dysideae]|uniref:Cas12f1-like TNB domain-containing protein n=1 Tax=Streptomyces dysideae TaxID=909626 RepID=A0A101UT54_9ACTN|nr:hypothetical protein AQJ91_36630 [Streptomyces dysideae]